MTTRTRTEMVRQNKAFRPRPSSTSYPAPCLNKKRHGASGGTQKMEYETIDVKEEDQNEMVLDEEFTEELQEEDGPILWDLEDQLYEKWREDNGTTEDLEQ